MDDFDPAATLSQEDPLRVWMAQYGQDPAMGLRLLTDPKGAAADLAAQGVPPPPMQSAMPDIIRTGRNGKIIGNLSDQGGRLNYSPEGAEITDSAPLGPNDASAMPTMSGAPSRSLAAALPPVPPRSNNYVPPTHPADLPQPKIVPQGYIPPVAPAGYDDPAGGTVYGTAPAQPPGARPQKAGSFLGFGGMTVPAEGSATPPSSPASPNYNVDRRRASQDIGLDPTTEGSYNDGRSRSTQDVPDAATDISAQKKPDATLDGLSKALAGLKALQPPAVNPVGTPSVRGAHASGAPNISQLLQVMGAQARPDALAGLGRLLVAGKA